MSDETTRTRKKERKIKRRRGRGKSRAFSRSLGELSGDPGESTDSFNHGNRISKAESRKNRERQRLIHRGKEGGDTHPVEEIA